MNFMLSWQAQFISIVCYFSWHSNIKSISCRATVCNISLFLFYYLMYLLMSFKGIGKMKRRFLSWLRNFSTLLSTSCKTGKLKRMLLGWITACRSKRVLTTHEQRKRYNHVRAIQRFTFFENNRRILRHKRFRFCIIVYHHFVVSLRLNITWKYSFINLRMFN